MVMSITDSLIKKHDELIVFKQYPWKIFLLIRVSKVTSDDNSHLLVPMYSDSKQGYIFSPSLTPWKLNKS